MGEIILQLLALHNAWPPPHKRLKIASPTISFLKSVTSHGTLFIEADESQKVDASHCVVLGRQPESAL